MSAAHEWLSLNAESGVLTWKKSPSANVKSGDVAGCSDGHGYITVTLRGQRWAAHRLIWTMVNGPIPSGIEIDHINGIRSDNRVANLRPVTRAENNQNLRGAKGKTATNLLGVSQHKRSGLFNARIKVNGRSRSLGYYKTPEEAHYAYLQCKREVHPANTI